MCLDNVWIALFQSLRRTNVLYQDINLHLLLSTHETSKKVIDELGKYGNYGNKDYFEDHATA